MVNRTTSNDDPCDYPPQESKQPIPSNRDDLPLDPNRMSVSRMQLWEKCPFAYRLNYEEDLRCLDESERLTSGKEMHDLFYRASLNAEPESIRFLPKYDKYQEDCERFIDFSRLMWRKNGTSIPLHAEYEIFDEDFNILMYIDRIDKFQDGIQVIDYKTGGYKDISCYRFQLAVYAYFAEKHLKLKVKRWGVFFSKKGMIKFEKADRHKMMLVPIIIKIIRERIQESRNNGQYPRRRTQLCNFCAFLQHGLCSLSIGQKKANGLFGLLEIFKDYHESEDFEKW